MVKQFGIRDADKTIQVLFEISSALNNVSTLDQLYKSIHKSLSKIFNVENIFIALYHENRNSITFPYYVDTTDENFVEVFGINEKQSMTAKVIKQNKALLATKKDLLKMASEGSGELIGTPCKVWIGAPLKIKDKAFGALVLQSYKSKDVYRESDLGILSSVSDFIAMAIDRKRTEDAEKNSREINRVMFAVSNAVNTTENLYELYRSIHETIDSVIDATNFMIGVYDHKKDSISYPYFADERDDDYSEIPNVSTSGILASEIINRAEPFFITREEIIERAKKMGDRGLGVIPRQWLGVPLKIKNEVIGVLVVQSYTNPELYTQRDVEVLLAVSEQVAMAIERKQSEENIKQNEKLTRTLFSISNAVNTTDNLNDLYNSIYNSLNTLIELPNFFIAIVDEKSKAMHFPFYKDEYDSEETISFTVDDYEESTSITTEVINSKKTLFFKKDELDKIAWENRLVGTVPVIWLGIPLIIREKVIGVMTVQHYSDPEYFTDREKDIFISVSDQVALAIDRKQSQEIILEREKQILQLSRQTQEFSLVAAAIISLKDEKEIFRIISKAIVKYSDYNRLIISYFIDESPYREIIQYEGISKKEIDKVKKKDASREYYEKIFQAGSKIGNLSWYLTHEDVAGLEDEATIIIQSKESYKKTNGWHNDDMIFIRMNDSDGKFIGVISVDDSKSGEKPTKETVRPLEVFSSLISQIMIFRKIQNELKDHKENLEKKVDERTTELTSEILERIQIEKKLIKAKTAAEAAARIKGEFLTNMSHEIRTPLNGIMGMAEIAMGNNLDNDLKKIIQTIDFEAGALLDIINQILDFSKIEAGKLALEEIPFDLRNTFEKACSLVSMGVKNKGIEFICFLDPDVPSKLIGDPGRLRQILLNLAGNALKFTQKGEIFIKAEKIRGNQNSVEVRFTIKDTGIGIAENKQKDIFDSFSQADGSIARKYGGTGLGTTISKQLVELMGGEIGLKSEVGKGSSFWFNVKFNKQKKKKLKEHETNINLNGLKILVVDDNKTIRFVLNTYLESLGIKPVVSENYKEGLNIIEQSFADKELFNAVIVNLEHSRIDGFDLAAKIREKTDFIKLPIIMLISAGRLGDGQACKDIGIDAYLLKPVKQTELKRAIAATLYNLNFEKEEDQKLITRHTIAEELIDSLRILVVEDYPTNQQIAMKHLESAGYQVVLAQNGKIAVDLFKKQQFDVIMMDIQMPVMDGYKATSLIRQHEAKIAHLNSDRSDPDNIVDNRTPIIAMTAHAIVGYKEKCLKADMDDYISKPIRREKFLEIVEKWTMKNQSNTDSEETLNISKKKNDIASQDIAPYGDPVDFITALHEFDNDREFLLEVIDEFILNVDKQLFKIKNAIKGNDAETLEKESHSIKGGAANLTAYDLSETAHKLEIIGKSQNLGGKGEENSSKAFDSFEKEFLRFKVFISRLKS